jgi:uncharacterized protein YqhQ
MQSMPSPPSSRPYIGGQAVLEGVMMRAPRSFSVVVRRRDGRLHVRERAMSPSQAGPARWPLVRGVATLVESLRLGNEALRFSAEKLEEDLEADSVIDKRQPGSHLGVLGALGLSLVALVTQDADPEGASREGASTRKRSSAGTWVLLIAAIAFFVALPQAAAAGVNRLLRVGLEVQSPLFQAMTGTLKLLIVVGYLLAIRRVPDILRVFQYHGAEHKTISTYEAGEPLTVANARGKTTMHPRCGTTFLVMVALVSILVFSAIGALLPRIHTGSSLADNVLFFLEKLPFLPVLVAVTFELQRFFARYCSTGPLRALLWPGFLVQKITTAEPDDAQLEVALASLKVTLFRQEDAAQADVADVKRGTPASDAAIAEGADVAFPSFEALVSAGSLRSASGQAA